MLGHDATALPRPSTGHEGQPAALPPGDARHRHGRLFLPRVAREPLAERARDYQAPLGWLAPFFVANVGAAMLAARHANRQKVLLKGVLHADVALEGLTLASSALRAGFPSSDRSPADVHVVNARARSGWASSRSRARGAGGSSCQRRTRGRRSRLFRGHPAQGEALVLSRRLAGRPGLFRCRSTSRQRRLEPGAC